MVKNFCVGEKGFLELMGIHKKICEGPLGPRNPISYDFQPSATEAVGALPGSPASRPFARPRATRPPRPAAKASPETAVLGPEIEAEPCPLYRVR